VAPREVIVVSTFGGVLGGSIAALLVVGFTGLLKAMLAVVSGQPILVVVLVPLLGLTLSVPVLYRLDLSSEKRPDRGRSTGTASTARLTAASGTLVS
jgi:hypothetical protein